ncbi:hypothetical protein BLNAU_9013 [Blattamonas nauphoetae]|uniref:Uncharacterized protein n=1 Tax=Blattamonas nauphoetae TaxID=2049346 RepID=A0ABQ9XX20_9EUKA|nr:hypothetical protein BLNAU_9013 [Blattamonas nauphoetae]
MIRTRLPCLLNNSQLSTECRRRRMKFATIQNVLDTIKTGLELIFEEAGEPLQQQIYRLNYCIQPVYDDEDEDRLGASPKQKRTAEIYLKQETFTHTKHLPPPPIQTTLPPNWILPCSTPFRGICRHLQVRTAQNREILDGEEDTVHTIDDDDEKTLDQLL